MTTVDVPPLPVNSCLLLDPLLAELMLEETPDELRELLELLV